LPKWPSAGSSQPAGQAEDKREAFIIRSTIKLISDLCRQETKAEALVQCAATAHPVLNKMAALKST
jgi:hypothetical protein